MAASLRVNQLSGDANALSGTSNATFNYVAHAEFFADLLNINWLSFLREGRVSSYDEQAFEMGQFRNDVLHDAVGKILLLRVAAHVLEGQDGDGGLVRNRKGLRFVCTPC